MSKKIIISSALLASLVASPALAKMGAYAGVNLTRQANGGGEEKSTTTTTTSKTEVSDGFGLGAFVGYQIPTNSKFLAQVEGFYNVLMGAESKASTTPAAAADGTTNKFTGNYGVNVNLGYDFGSFAPFVVLGYGVVSYDDTVTTNTGRSKKSYSEGGFLYGVGATYKMCEDTSLFLRYTELMYNHTRTHLNTAGVSTAVDSDRLFKQFALGVAYKF